MGIKCYEPGQSQYWSAAIAAIAKKAEDPDSVLADWVERGFALGIECKIENTGVVPAVSTDSAAVEESRVFGRIEAENPTPLREHANYESFYAEEKDADADLARTVEAGFAERVTEQELRTRFGDTHRPRSELL